MILKKKQNKKFFLKKKLIFLKHSILLNIKKDILKSKKIKKSKQLTFSFEVKNSTEI
jgi:hypothetical protein